MKATTEYFADTYALIEIVKGRPQYAPYARMTLHTSKQCLAELALWAIRRRQTDHATQLLDAFWPVCIEPERRTILDAMRLKHARREDRLSYTDCIGYTLATELDIPFLTGDQKFEDLPNVEFVK